MPMTIDEKRVMKAYFHRKMRTVPFLIIMLFSLLPLCTYTFDWVRAQLAWHKTEAAVWMVTDEGSAQYRYTVDKTAESLSGSVSPYKILMHYTIGKTPKVNDAIRMAYNPKDPVQHVLFSSLELRMLTWAIVFVFSFIIYFWLEWDIKKRAKIKVAG